jgi:Asp-tRNA(Asn)/Glu-tRNA(Gln) amidotransferase A subunit family amidase
MCFNDISIIISSLFFGTSGYDSSCGQVDRCYKEAEHDALIVKVLKGSGAIPFLKSNIDVIGKENFIWGRYDTTLSHICI